MLEIALRKKEFEEHLNKMWRIYSTGNVSQIMEYNKQVESIKQRGYKVMRNSEGNHKLILIKNNSITTPRDVYISVLKCSEYEKSAIEPVFFAVLKR